MDCILSFVSYLFNFTSFEPTIRITIVNNARYLMKDCLLLLNVYKLNILNQPDVTL